MKFDHEIILCNPEDIHPLSAELESEWIFSLLQRFKVDPKVMKRFKEDPHYTRKEWRDFLFDNYGVRIHKDLTTGRVEIKRLDFDQMEDLKLGYWEPPAVTRVRNRSESYVELHLKYWNIV